ncbi:MAG: DUF429 domain-containing protein [Pseudomonadota bacterium]|nr:DUF429 domain-containing protein [Pseudomonadota bacterium]
MMETEQFVGIDGSKLGWVAVFASRYDFVDAKCIFVNNLVDLTKTISPTAKIVIDIPIGLEINQPQRECDKLGRQFLGSRRSTLFSPPCRDAIEENSFESANITNKRKVGIGLSKQSWFLRNKIIEARSAISCGLLLKEGHPECSFAAVNGSPILSKKKTVKGILKRLKCLSELGFDSEQIVSDLPEHRGFKIDDYLDAAILCWTASRVSVGKHFTFPPTIPNNLGALECTIYV